MRAVDQVADQSSRAEATNAAIPSTMTSIPGDDFIRLSLQKGPSIAVDGYGVM